MTIEHKSIDYVAEHERHGRVVDQVSFWFLGNLVGLLVCGAVYLWLSRSFDPTREALATRESDRILGGVEANRFAS